MYLKELTINGFKSFAKKSELEFSASITAVVGPNGSGKSNIAEAFRFVLGEQSVKSMRGKRGEDLIWGGSDKIGRGNRANVEVLFDNTDRTFSLDFDEVKVERVVHRDGQNEYKINGSPVRLKDVHELLAGANIGSTGHHIISQGEADRVLSAGPKERREMIEDALGLKVYQIKKQETERKLEKTKENIQQVEQLRREIAPHLKYLKKQVEKAERSLEIQEKLKTLYAEYLKREDSYVAFHFDRLNNNRKEPADKLEEVKKRLEEVNQIIKDTEVVTESAELTEAEKELKQASQKRQEAEKEVSAIAGQISFIEKRLNNAKQSKQSSDVLIPRRQLEEVVEVIEADSNKALGKGGESTLKRALTDSVHKLRNFLKKAEGEVIDTTETDKAELEELQKSLKTAEKAATEEVEKEKAKQDIFEKIKSEQEQGTEKNRDAEREMFQLMNDRRDLETTIKEIDQELTALERDRDDFKQQLQEAVSLLGRSASDYFNYEITDKDGNKVSNEVIVEEDRSVQRERKHELEKLKIRLEELGMGATEDLIKEYNDTKERDDFFARELADLESSVENLRQLISDMDTKLQEQFGSGIEKITKEFNSFFTLMFGGGSAALKLVSIGNKTEEEEDDDAKEETGVDLSVSLPNKKVRGLEMLSGGERALTSIALIFAMSQVNPPPFIILDETDAALDEANSRRYGDMIEALAKKSQLVLITHNRETMSRAGILYGVTMGEEGVSKILSVKFDEALAAAK